MDSNGVDLIATYPPQKTYVSYWRLVTPDGVTLADPRSQRPAAGQGARHVGLDLCRHHPGCLVHPRPLCEPIR